MVSLDRRFAGTPDVVMRKKVKNAPDVKYEYMIIDHKLSGSFSTSRRGPALFKKNEVLEGKAARLVALGYCSDMDTARRCVRLYYIGSLNETVFCHRIAQLAAYATLGTEGGYFPNLAHGDKVQLVVMVGHPSLAKKVRWMEVSEYPQGIVDLMFPRHDVEVHNELRELCQAGQASPSRRKKECGEQVLHSPRTPVTRSKSKHANSFHVLSTLPAEEPESPCTQEYHSESESEMEDTEPQTNEVGVAEENDSAGQEHKCDEDQNNINLSGASRQSPKKAGLTGMHRGSPKKLKEGERDLVAGAVPSTTP